MKSASPPNSVTEKVKSYLSRLGLEAQVLDLHKIEISEKNLELFERDRIFNELLGLATNFFELESLLSDSKQKFHLLGRFVGNLLSMIIECDDFGDPDIISKNISLSLIELVECENFTVLELIDNDLKLRFQVGAIKIPSKLLSSSELKSYIYNNVDIALNCCDIRSSSFYTHLCKLGVDFLRLLSRYNKRLGILALVCTKKPIVEEQTYFIKTAFDFMYFVYQLHYFERQIKDYAIHLESLVEERTLHLEKERKKAEEANLAKSRFISNMSHELRTPLTAIVGYANILRDGLLGSLSPEQLDAITSINQASEHLKQLIDDVLNLARIESGKEIPKPEPISLEEISSVVKLLKSNFDKKNQVVEIQHDQQDFEGNLIMADKRHFRQIMLNLLSNANKYTPENGEIKIRVSRMADKIKIEVKDTGIGIPEEVQSRLFERFERGTDQYSRSQEGTGIGLSITKSLVELNGGIIGVESSPGKGSNFWVLLPASSVNQCDVITETLIDTNLKLDNVKILLVEDEKISAELLKLIFTKHGGTVVEAGSVQEAIDILKAQTPDLIVTDVGLTGTNSGLDLLEHVRAKLKLRVPVVVISASLDPKLVQSALEVGANDFIQKPFNPNQLVLAVSKLVREYFLETA
ncbi:MAG: ATP-binding protein [Deltaproteobacteria bacterium]|nr:ATP-binding protein [Deltaproteobacteria bacterium]